MAGVDEHGRPEPAPAAGEAETVLMVLVPVARQRSAAERGLDGLAARAWSDGRAPNLRWILVHLVEEHSRHNGHADLLRESVDGLTGE